MSEEIAASPRSAAIRREGETSDADAGSGHPSLNWNVDIPLFRSAIVLKQLALALGIPILLVSIFLLILEWPIELDEAAAIGRIALLLVGIFLVLLIIALGLVYGGRYEYQYRFNAKGARGRPRGGTAKKNTVINWLLMLSGRPGAAGAGLLAHSRQLEYVSWNDVYSVTTDARQRTITLRDEARHWLMVVFCDRAHYEEALQFARAVVEGRNEGANQRAGEA